jgi:hypothetical protein
MSTLTTTITIIPAINLNRCATIVPSTSTRSPVRESRAIITLFVLPQPMVHQEQLDRGIRAQKPNHLQSRDRSWTAFNRTQTNLLCVRAARFERWEYRSISARLKPHRS